MLGSAVQPVTALRDSGAGAVLVAGFDADKLIAHLQPFLPPGAMVLSLDAMRLPAHRLTRPADYLNRLNFATNFALFRDTESLHTRLVTVNYWSTYSGATASLWLTLFDGDGGIIAEWCEITAVPTAP